MWHQSCTSTLCIPSTQTAKENFKIEGSDFVLMSVYACVYVQLRVLCLYAISVSQTSDL